MELIVFFAMLNPVEMYGVDELARLYEQQTVSERNEAIRQTWNECRQLARKRGEPQPLLFTRTEDVLPVAVFLGGLKLVEAPAPQLINLNHTTPEFQNYWHTFYGSRNSFIVRVNGDGVPVTHAVDLAALTPSTYTSWLGKEAGLATTSAQSVLTSTAGGAQGGPRSGVDSRSGGFSAGRRPSGSSSAYRRRPAGLPYDLYGNSRFSRGTNAYGRSSGYGRRPAGLPYDLYGNSRFSRGSSSPGWRSNYRSRGVGLPYDLYGKTPFR